MAQQQTWQQWIEKVYNLSDRRINYWNPLVDESSAKTEHPNLYHDYQSGVSPEDFVNTHLVHYDEYPNKPVARIDPDSEPLPDNEYQEEQ